MDEISNDEISKNEMLEMLERQIMDGGYLSNCFQQYFGKKYCHEDEYNYSLSDFINMNEKYYKKESQYSELDRMFDDVPDEIILKVMIKARIIQPYPAIFLDEGGIQLFHEKEIDEVAQSFVYDTNDAIDTTLPEKVNKYFEGNQMQYFDDDGNLYQEYKDYT